MNKRKFPILLYHGVSECRDDAIRDPYYALPEASIRAQLSWLSGHRCVSLSLDEALSPAAGAEYAFSLTVDDGLKSSHSHLFPLFLEKRIRASFFPVAATVGRRGWVSWKDLDEMRRGGMEIGSHTMTHANLAETARDEALEELVSSRKLIEDNLGIRVKFLSLPGGYRGPLIAALAAEAGYAGVCGSEFGYNAVPIDRYRLKRFCLRGADDAEVVRRIMEGDFLRLAPRYLAERGRAIFRAILGRKAYAALRSRLVPPGVHTSLPRFPYESEK